MKIQLTNNFQKYIKFSTWNNFKPYVQGQEPEPKVREYFYYVDHQGMLFLDDAKIKNFTSCFKEKQFLKFFFVRLRTNSTGRYQEFPYVSICGKERNFVRCSDYPIVFTHVIQKVLEHATGKHHLAHNHADFLLTVPFQPERIFVSPENGKVYHPAPDKCGSIGLVSSKLAIEFSNSFLFNNIGQTPTNFLYDGTNYVLDNTWYHNLLTNQTKL